MADNKHWYDVMVERGKKDFPQMEDRHCSKCGEELVRGSYNYHQGRHIDGCPFINNN